MTEKRVIDSFIGKKGLIVYEENGKPMECFAEILGADKNFLFLKTHANILLINMRNLNKIKIRGGI